MTATDDYTPEVQRQRRSIGLPCGVIGILAVVTVIYSFITTHSRYQVIGKTDPATGYRIEYTMSSRYRNLDMNDPQMLKSNHELEDWTYIPNPRLAPVRWYYTWILRRPDAATELDENADIGGELKAHEIQQITFLGNPPNGHRTGPDGYIQTGDIAGLGEIAANEKAAISNCPATWYSFDRSGTSLRYYNLFIRPKGRGITFMFSGISDAGQEPNDVLDELTAIRDSIHIVKVK